MQPSKLITVILNCTHRTLFTYCDLKHNLSYDHFDDVDCNLTVTSVTLQCLFLMVLPTSRSALTRLVTDDSLTWIKYKKICQDAELVTASKLLLPSTHAIGKLLAINLVQEFVNIPSLIYDTFLNHPEQFGYIYEVLKNFKIQYIPNPSLYVFDFERQTPGAVALNLLDLKLMSITQKQFYLKKAFKSNSFNLPLNFKKYCFALSEADLTIDPISVTGGKTIIGLLIKQPQFLIVNSDSRRKTGCHFTPRDMCKEIVTNTLNPLLNEILNSTTQSATIISKILQLKIADITVGGGVFLIEAADFLSKQIFDIDPSIYSSQEVIALISMNCLFGFDIDDFAIEITKLSLWLYSFDYFVENKITTFSFARNFVVTDVLLTPEPTLFRD